MRPPPVHGVAERPREGGAGGAGRPSAARPATPSSRFGPFVLESASYRLLRDGTVLPLSPKAIDLLLYLVARPSSLVTKQELLSALWPGVAVTENALTQAVS